MTEDDWYFWLVRWWSLLPVCPCGRMAVEDAFYLWCEQCMEYPGGG